MNAKPDPFILTHDREFVSRRNFLTRTAGIAGGTFAIRSGLWTPPISQAGEAGGGAPDVSVLTRNPGSALAVADLPAAGADQVSTEILPEHVGRADVQRFGRIVQLMTAKQLRLASVGLATEKVPDELAKSLAPEETTIAPLMLAWMKRWRARSAEPRIRRAEYPGEMASCVPSRSAPVFRTFDDISIPSIAAPPAKGHAEYGSSAPASRADQTKLYLQLCQVLDNRLLSLQRRAQQISAEATGTLNHAKEEYQAALKDKEKGNQLQAWSHLLAAMNGLNQASAFTERVMTVCNETEAVLQSIDEAFPCGNELKEKFSHACELCQTALSIGSPETPRTDLWQLHFALIRLGQQIDMGEAVDPPVSCVDLSQTGDWWDWFWKQVRGGWGGDTNPPGWLPVDWNNLVQTAFGTIESVSMEPDGDIHINLADCCGWSSIHALVNGNNPSGQLICEIPLCDRQWFSNLDQICVGKLMFVVGKWMIDVWHWWYELHPVYQLEVIKPVIVG